MVDRHARDVSEAATMSVAAIWGAAYFLTGLVYVVRDIKQPALNRPTYTHSVAGVIAVVLAWPLVTLRMAFVYGRFGPDALGKYLATEAAPTWAIFLLVGIFGSKM